MKSDQYFGGKFKLLYQASVRKCCDKLKVKLIFTVLISLFSSHTLLFSQLTSNVVDLKSPDTRRLEWTTLDQVNSFRQDVNLPDLIWDQVLYGAAKDHADYLLHTGYGSHSQKSKEKRTCVKRVVYYGGKNYTFVGENILTITLGTQLSLNGGKINSITYGSAAKTMATLWKYSPQQYKNIISDKFNYTALAISYDSVTQDLVAVQVFGFSNSLPVETKYPDYSNGPLHLPEPKLPYGLKEYRFNKKDKYAVDAFLKLKMEQGYITGSYRNAKKIFRGIRSGISQEFIMISDYDSNSINFSMVPNRRNGMYELNGALSKPVYRGELLRYSRLNSHRKYIIYTKWIKIKEPTKHFLYPLWPNSSEMEYNLFLIKNRRLTAWTSYLNVPSQFFNVAFPPLNFISGFDKIDTLPKYKTNSTYDTMNIKLVYPVAKTEIDTNRQKEIIDVFNGIQGKVVEISASAYASVEGNLASNEELAGERMAEFINLAGPWLNKIDFNYELVTGEQWDLFYRQIKDTPFRQLRGLSKEEARSFINEHRDDSIISNLLDEQRYMEFMLISRQDNTVPVISEQSPVERYDSLLALLNTTERPTTKLFQAVEQAQLAYYHHLSLNDTLLSQPVLPFPDWDKHPEFKYHHLVFKYMFLKNITDKEFFLGLHEPGFSKYFPRGLKDELLYNNILLIYKCFLEGNIHDLIDNVSCQQMRHRDFYFRKFTKFTCSFIPPDETYYALSEIPVFIKLQKKINQDKYTNELWKFYYLEIIKSLATQIPFRSDEVNKYLRGFKKYFHPDDGVLTDGERLKYAFFYCAINKRQVAKKLIEPIAVRENPHIEGLKLYATLKAEDFDNEHEFANYLISQFPRLGESAWCDIWKTPAYLNALLLEDLKLKNFYNCNCDR